MKHEAVYILYPNVTTIRNDEAYDADGDKVEIDMDLVDAWQDPDQYKFDRASEYPSFADQFDLLYHGGYDAWKAEIDKVKEKYPKP
jgi:hypothetical protein